MKLPALIIPGDDSAHRLSAAHYLNELLPEVEFWNVTAAGAGAGARGGAAVGVRAEALVRVGHPAVSQWRPPAHREQGRKPRATDRGPLIQPPALNIPACEAGFNPETLGA
jgi:hypothetical protein